MRILWCQSDYNSSSKDEWYYLVTLAEATRHKCKLNLLLNFLFSPPIGFGVEGQGKDRNWLRRGIKGDTRLMSSLSKTHHYKTYPRFKRFCLWWCSVTAPAYKSIPPIACSRHINSLWHPTEGYKWWRMETENRMWTEENFSLKAGNVCVCPLNQQNEPLPEQPTATLSLLITVGLIVVLQRRWIWKYSWGRLRSDCEPLSFCFTDRSHLPNTLSYSPFLSLILVF